MSMGNILSTLEDKFGELDPETVLQLYHCGELERFRPDGHWWLMQTDQDGNIESIETVDDEQGQQIAHTTAMVGGGFIHHQRGEDGAFRLTINRFPHIKTDEIFK